MKRWIANWFVRRGHTTFTEAVLPLPAVGLGLSVFAARPLDGAVYGPFTQRADGLVWLAAAAAAAAVMTASIVRHASGEGRRTASLLLASIYGVAAERCVVSLGPLNSGTITYATLALVGLWCAFAVHGSGGRAETERAPT